MTVFIPVASGKGGTGKTVFSTNLGVMLARGGKTVILVDLDLGGSNLHTCLGIMNNLPGIGNFIYRKEHNLASLLVRTGIDRLHFIPGDALLPGTANMDGGSKRKLLTAVKGLVADYVIMDLGSGTSFNTIDFFLLAMNGVIVTSPEITSVLNAYSFIKTALFRLLSLSFPPKSDERKTVADFITAQIEGEKRSFRDLFDAVVRITPSSGKTVVAQMSAFVPRVIVNMERSGADASVGAKLDQIVSRNLGIRTDCTGHLPYDAGVGASIAQRRPHVLTAADSPYARALASIARTIVARDFTGGLPVYEPDADLEKLLEKVEAL